MKEKLNQISLPYFVSFFLFMVWIYLNFSATKLFTFGTGQADTFTNYLVSTLSNGVVLIFFAIFYKKLEKLMFSPAIGMISVFCCTIGTLCSSFSNTEVFQAFPYASLLGGLLTGLGSAPILLMLGCLLTRRGNLLPTMIAAFLLSNVAVALLSLLPAMILLLVVVSLPPTITLLLFADSKAPYEQSQKPVREDIHKLTPLLVKLAIMIFVFNAVNGLTKTTYRGQMSQISISMALLATTALITAILLFAYLSYRKLIVITLYRTVVLTFVIAFLVAPLIHKYSGFSYGMILVTVTALRSLFYIIEYQICIKTGLSPLLVFGIGEAFKKLPVIIVAFLMESASETSIASLAENYLPLFLIPAILFVVIYTLIFTENDAYSLTALDKTLADKEILERKCLQFAEEKGLSDRETEVLILIGQGRNTPRIADELYLSQGTINVYMRKLYQKMDVHSRQELLDMIEKKTYRTIRKS